MSIQEKLKGLMKVRGVGAFALAKKSGVHPSSIKNIIYGKSLNPSDELIKKLASGLKCRESDLVETSLEQAKYNSALYKKAFWEVNKRCSEIGVTVNETDLEKATNLVYDYSEMFDDEDIDRKFLEYVLDKILTAQDPL